jgi:hypothetical protein
LAERREMVDVELGTNILGFPKAAFDVGIDGPRTEIVVNGYEDDTYEDVTRQICRALAVLGFRGEVRLFCDGGAEEEKREIFANVGHLKGVLWLTDEYAAGVAAEEVEQAEKEDADFGRIMRFMQEEGLRRGRRVMSITAFKRSSLLLSPFTGPPPSSYFLAGCPGRLGRGYAELRHDRVLRIPLRLRQVRKMLLLRP